MLDFDVFAARLRVRRASQKLTLQQIGDAVNCTKATIGNLENGKLTALFVVTFLQKGIR